MHAEILCFGTELLKDKVNTNGNALAEKLYSIGIAVQRILTVGDDKVEIKYSLSDSLKRSDLILTCGGLVPTFDDLTRECVAKIILQPLIFSDRIAKKIERRFKSRRLLMPEENLKQAYLVSGAREIPNGLGTAPGQFIKYRNKILILLPGPARECLPMMDQTVIPYLMRYQRLKTRSLVLHVFGYPESEIDAMIQPVIMKNWKGNLTGDVNFGILAHRSVVDVKVSVSGEKMNNVEKVLNQIKNSLQDILGDRIYGADEDTLSSIVARSLTVRKETLAVAESCTGGMISQMLTEIPGSSHFFLSGAVTYSNQSKSDFLKVHPATLSRYGAVSRECAEEMARGIRKKSGSSWALSVTGIAGPSGGTKEKPVGTVYFALAGKRACPTAKQQFYGSRTEIRNRAALAGLDFLRRNFK